MTIHTTDMQTSSCSWPRIDMCVEPHHRPACLRKQCPTRVAIAYM